MKFKTVTIQIGNSDDKLTQAEWSKFISAMRAVISNYGGEMHFTGVSSGFRAYQNACFVFVISEDVLPDLKKIVSRIGKEYKQDSVAWTIGETEFI